MSKGNPERIVCLGTPPRFSSTLFKLPFSFKVAVRLFPIQHVHIVHKATTFHFLGAARDSLQKAALRFFRNASLVIWS